jgi:hypothetical protein
MNQASNPFFEAALAMQKQWTKAMSSMSHTFSGKSPENIGLDPAVAAQAWSEGMLRLFEQSMTSQETASMGMTQLIEHIQRTANTYASLMSAFTQMRRPKDSKNTETDSEDLNEGSDAVAWLKNMFEPMSTWIPTPMPAPGAEGAQAWQQSMSKMAANWARLLTELSVRSKRGFEAGGMRTDEAQNFYNSWLKAYEPTIGRFINIAKVGPSRYEFEKLSKSADTYLKYQAATSDFLSRMFETGVETLQEVMDKSNALFSGEVNEETLDQFYHLLLTVGERRYYELFSSPLFCQSLEAFITTGLDFLKAWNDITEEMLKNTPIVTQSQADEVHKEIYLLKKRVAELERLAVDRARSE